MAEKTIRIDDLDESEGPDVERREFTLLDRKFGIDLKEENHTRLTELLEELEPFLEASTEVVTVTAKRKKLTRPATVAGGHTLSDVRKWAKEKNFEVSDHGKVSDTILQDYFKEYPDAKPE